jgi:hypothetical protein
VIDDVEHLQKNIKKNASGLISREHDDTIAAGRGKGAVEMISKTSPADAPDLSSERLYQHF